jgi:hypothetical protein
LFLVFGALAEGQDGPVRSGWLRVVLVVLAICASGCGKNRRASGGTSGESSSRSDPLVDRNAEPFAPYTRFMIRSNQAIATVTTCAMFGGTRVGYCLVEATPEQLQDLVDKIGLAPDAPDGGAAIVDHGLTSCLTLPDFGTTAGGIATARPGTTRLRATKPMPPNTHNIKFRQTYRAPGGARACFEYEFPYG